MNENLLTIEELCKELGIGRSKAYQLLKDKQIPSGKIGRRILVRRSDVDRYIDRILNAK
jgi:excisionase family DNA binding protein